MSEIKLKRLTLLLLECLVLQDNIWIDETFVNEFNDFIYQYYKQYKNLFSIIYEPKILEEFIDNRWIILSQDQMITLINRYHGFEGYANLVDSVGPEMDKQLITLATLFLEYHNNLIDLYYADQSIYYSKSYLPYLKYLKS